MAEAPLIELRNATLYRGSTRVFDDLTMTIQQGEQIAVLGPNGAGKSTLLKAINGELYPVRTPETVFRILGKERWATSPVSQNARAMLTAGSGAKSDFRSALTS